MIFYALASCFALVTAATDYPIGTIGEVTSQSIVQKLDSGSELVALYTTPAYVDPIYVLSVHGASSYDQGFDAGVLFGKQMSENMDNLFVGLFGDNEIEPTLAEITVEFMVWQWNAYLSKDVPQEYMDEISGLQAGGESVGVPSLGNVTAAGIVLTNLPGDGKDIVYVFLDEWMSGREAQFTPSQKAFLPTMAKMLSNFGHQCSMFGVWGSRTIDGNLLSARNLDWMTNLGINKYKLITVHHPASGHAHATVGYAGIWGAMAGMSEAGITVHEANLESKLDTFQGFPWILRLRHLMSYSEGLDDSLQLWNNTKNTVGFNHMVGSAKDKKAVVMETMKGFTAVFEAQDNREEGAIDPYTGDVYGYTLSDAVYRTNHGYDPVTQENYQWYGYGAYEDSKRRYKAIHDYIQDFEAAGTMMGAQEAVTITSAVGIKGDGTDEDQCNPALYLKGENIMSVTYDPAMLTVYTAFEDGADDAWVPAACNGYIQLNLTQWF